MQTYKMNHDNNQQQVPDPMSGLPASLPLVGPIRTMQADYIEFKNKGERTQWTVPELSLLQSSGNTAKGIISAWAQLWGSSPPPRLRVSLGDSVKIEKRLLED